MKTGGWSGGWWIVIVNGEALLDGLRVEGAVALLGLVFEMSVAEGLVLAGVMALEGFLAFDFRFEDGFVILYRV